MKIIIAIVIICMIADAALMYCLASNAGEDDEQNGRK